MPHDDPARLFEDAARLMRQQRDEYALNAVPVADDVLTRRAAPPSAAAVQEAGEAALELPDEPAEALQVLKNHLADCRRCKLCKGRTTVVFGVGNPKARLMFVGEGPGRDEDLQGEPFVGAAGQLLNRMITAMTLRRDDIYIANIVKCRPPRNRDPEPDEVQACEPFLRQQIQIVKPEVIVGLGRYAVQTLLRDSTAISRQRGKWRMYENIPLMPTFHPAYLLRNPAEKRVVWQDLQEVMGRLGLRPG